MTMIPDGGGAVGKTEFEDDCPEEFKYMFNQSVEKRRYVEDRVVGEFAGSLAESRKFLAGFGTKATSVMSARRENLRMICSTIQHRRRTERARRAWRMRASGHWPFLRRIGRGSRRSPRLSSSVRG